MAAIVFYADDLLIVSNHPEKLNKVKTKLSQVFEMKNMSEPENFLGVDIKRDKEKQKMTINQVKYTEKILMRFGMKNCKPKDIPMQSRQTQTKRFNKISESGTQVSRSKVPYREDIGSLLYPAGGTRPDISYGVNILSRYQSNPTSKEGRCPSFFLVLKRHSPTRFKINRCRRRTLS